MYSLSKPSHPLLPNLTSSEVEPHIAALEEAGIYNDLTQEQQAVIIRLMQQAYRNGQASQGAEKVDSDAVWLDGVGALEKQPDGTWKLTMPDKGIDTSTAAKSLRAIPSQKRSEQSRVNGQKGGRKPGSKNKPKRNDAH